MALLALQDPVGFTTVAASSGGDQVLQGTRAGGWALDVMLFVDNGGAGSITVTVDGRDYSVPAGGRALVPVYGIYHGQAKEVEYSDVSSVTVAAVRIAHAQA